MFVNDFNYKSHQIIIQFYYGTELEKLCKDAHDLLST